MATHLSILGSTGSIGRQALEVADEFSDLFKIIALSANSNIELLASQALKYKPDLVAIGDSKLESMLRNLLSHTNIKVCSGPEGLNEVAAYVIDSNQTNVLLTATVGFSGLKPTITGISSGKTIALANKETLVVAGKLVMDLAEQNKVSIIPVDSEHSAIFQCLMGENIEQVDRLILTASGGPFRGFSKNKLENVTKEQTLKHPNWEMGAKITVDSATLVNKGLEIIEAKWIFGINEDRISVVVHPQSIIHSMIEFQDGVLKAQMGNPDMRLPIQFALMNKNRLPNSFQRFDFLKYPSLTFETLDTSTFEGVSLACQSLSMGGSAPCVFNSANEIAVSAFLKNQISFLEIYDIIREALDNHSVDICPSLENLINIDSQTRMWALDLINTKKPVEYYQKMC